MGCFKTSGLIVLCHKDNRYGNSDIGDKDIYKTDREKSFFVLVTDIGISSHRLCQRLILFADKPVRSERLASYKIFGY